MKRAGIWIVGVVVASSALMLTLRAEQPPMAKTDKDMPAVSQEKEKKEGKVAFTFSNDDQMKQFAQIWQQRQVVLTRMAVLQDYWSLEQSGLGNINKDLLAKFNLDVNKNYTLDTDRKVLLEREAPAATPPAELGSTPAPAPAATTATP